MTKKEMYCNLCGSRFGFYDEQAEFSIHKHIGYGSKNDGAYVELDICCNCMDALIERCAIRPIEVELDDGGFEEAFNEN